MGSRFVLLLQQRSTRLLALHSRTSPSFTALFRGFSAVASTAKDEGIEGFDPRKLPTNYDPVNFDPAAAPSRVPPSERVWRLVDDVSVLSLAEVAELSFILREKLGIKDPPIVGIMNAGSGAGGFVGGAGTGAAGCGKEEKKQEKTVFELKLEAFDAAAKLKVIKEVRAFTDLGLKEAKELVEKAPAVIKSGLSKEEAEQIIEKMKAVGAKMVMQ